MPVAAGAKHDMPLGHDDDVSHAVIRQLKYAAAVRAIIDDFDARQCRVVELLFFAGLNIPEAADALGVSTATVEREWAMAKAWLHRRLSAHE